jgi:hypothetical protein
LRTQIATIGGDYDRANHDRPESTVDLQINH